MDTPTDNPPVSNIDNPTPIDPPVENTEKKVVRVVDNTSSFFQKEYEIIKEDLEHVVVLIEVEGEKFFHLFHRNQVQPKATLPVVTTIGETKN